MNESKDKPEGKEKEQIQYREFSEDQFKQILEEHSKWLGTNGKEGKQANLERANLQKFNLTGVQLEKAHLKEVNLEKVDLTKANLEQADLEKANLQQARMYKASLRWANLQKANLENADLQQANLNWANLEEAVLRKAYAHGASLVGAHLNHAKLEEVNLYNADLTDADLTEANLEGSDLRRAKLNKAHVLRAKLRDANLQDADLTYATGLLGEQFAATDVSGAKLPPPIIKFDGVKIVEEASRNARKLFLLMLIGCVYAWLTIGTTTDVRLLTNSASSPLPIIGAQIPIVGFYWAAPIFLLGIYIYFHLYLQRIWENLAELPAVFPDGRSLNKTVYPWLLYGFIRAHFVQLRSDRPPLSRLESTISILLAWWIVPLTLLLFWGRYIRRHDWTITILQIVFIAVTTTLCMIFQQLTRNTLRGQPTRRIVLIHVPAGFVIFTLFLLMSLGAIEGVPPYRGTGIKTWIPRVFETVNSSTFANIEEEDISMKPDNWTGDSSQISLVKGAKLKGRDLRHARAFRAFLVRADLREADLRGAILREADLRNATLHSANLESAQLLGANLQRANLSRRISPKRKQEKLLDKSIPVADFMKRANLRYCRLINANLCEAYLSEAILEDACLWAANLEKAALDFANLKGADLLHANLRGADLTGAVLDSASLRYADLRGADLLETSFSGADLYRTNFRGTNLRGAKELTFKHIEQARIDAKTQLPSYLIKPGQAEQESSRKTN